MNEQRIIIPEYVTRVKISNSRRPTYYVEGQTIPIKYKNNSQYIFKDKKFLHYTKSLLFNAVEKVFVVKNKNFLDKPRYLTIGGNMLYAGMNERIRMIMIGAIKEDFKKYIKLIKPINKFPIHINAEMYAIPGLRNWDMDNLWIYIKAFQDLLITYNIIPDDSVRYITKAPSFEYFPVSNIKHRKFVFIITPDNRSVTNHVMFAHKPTPLLRLKGQYKSLDTVIYISVEDKNSDKVTLERTGIHFKAGIRIGVRKLIYSKLTDALVSVRYWAIQYNATVVIDHNMATEYPNYDRDQVENLIEKHLCQEGIKVIIHNLI